jgi:hypothetical protein
MGIAGAVAVLSDICLTLVNVHEMNDEIGDWAWKLWLNIVATEDEWSDVEG